MIIIMRTINFKKLDFYLNNIFLQTKSLLFLLIISIIDINTDTNGYR